MKTYRQFDPIIIADFECETWEHPEHKHNHYELIYIKNGSGKHVIKQQVSAYQKGSVFLLGPEDEHYFKIESSTHFVYIKFTDAYIHQKSSYPAMGIQHLEYLIKSRETHLSGFDLKEQDQQIINLLFEVIRSLKEDTLLNEELIWMQLLVMATILQRNMTELKPTLNRSRDMQAIFCYIHKYIYIPEKLKASQMATHFNLSEEYIGPYFKRNTGNTLRDYIREYRGNLLKKRLDSGQYGLKQIANEFGLTDESHLSKLIKELQIG